MSNQSNKNVNDADNVYKELAKSLDALPNGYPATQSGVEIKILERLFSAEEAEMATHLDLTPRTAKIIAQKTGQEEREVFARLKTMVRKKLIEMERGDGALAFKLMPFIVGLYEDNNPNMDEEFARLFEQYYKEALHGMMTVKPSVHRVIPIEQTIPVNVEVMPYERASTYLDNAQSWGVLRCICRTQKQMIGEGCDHSTENCLVFTTRPNAFERRPEYRAITKEEAYNILKDAAREGLVHTTGNTRQDLNYICNCCTCCCGILRGVAEFGHVNAVGQSDFLAEVDESLCTGCEACLDRCLFNALKMEDDLCRVDASRCYGCGQCILACPVEAITLKQKEAVEAPPETEAHWQEVRTAARKSRDEE